MSAQGPVSPDDLLQEYQTNDFAAEQKYRGRSVKVAGAVSGKQAGGNEVPYVLLKLAPNNPNRQDSIRAMFQENSTQIKAVRTGDRLTVSCAPSYDHDIDTITLNDCSVLK
jgi:hypothetical protein